jgi:hypothetical protein
VARKTLLTVAALFVHCRDVLRVPYTLITVSDLRRHNGHGAVVSPKKAVSYSSSRSLHTTGELVQEEPIRVLTDGVALALVRDPTRSLPWLVTTTALYQVLCYVHHSAVACVLLVC